MRRLLAVFVAALLALAGPASAKPEKADGYKGADAGRLVLSIVEGDDVSGFSGWLELRKTDATGAPDPRFKPFRAYLGAADFSLPKPADWSSRPKTLLGALHRRQAGVIVVKRLPPGSYEVYNLGAVTSHSGATVTFSLRSEISIPIEVKPGHSVYIGQFEAIGVMGPNRVGITIPVDVRFQVSDQSGRDFSFALRKDSAVGLPEVAILDTKGVDEQVLVRAPAAYDKPYPQTVR